MSLLIILSIFLVAAIGSIVFFNFAPQLGASASGERLERMQSTSNYKGGIFHNTISTDMTMNFKKMGPIMWEFIKGSPDREPSSPINTHVFDANKFMNHDGSQIAITWFGHSTLLIKIEGKVILIDPVFSNRASMFSFMGPKRFNYSNPVRIEDLPPLDAVIISHDHYDHLDYQAILALKGKVDRFFVPLGVGEHLEKWGIPSDQITEAKWWDEMQFDESISLACTPSRHFSGRGLNNRFSTLWCSWVIIGRDQRIFFGGDSGYFPGFKEIGEKYGPFDLTMLECGAYNENWYGIHMIPEETAQAHVDLGGAYLMPIHWGKFNLSLHPWKEPIQRVLKKAEELKVEIITPEIGSIMLVGKQMDNTEWWKQYD